MAPSLEIEYNLDEEPAKIWATVTGEGVSAKTECYVNYGILQEFAKSLSSFPINRDDVRVFGEASASGSYCVMQFATEGSTGLVLATIRYANGDYEQYRSEGTIRFQTDLGSIDTFSKSLLSAINDNYGTATLIGRI